ncbi:uncharacterized protein C8Q71DRAFT_786748 [Rhodofomes roseus]|uniref:Uncharacterized protein n=1 Tax=Rhodofomes roseus TaxID=34475 RepID=A0ABQ8K0X0_9APHY|nr:uncharacterized protein C8Q71DRAFT_786748 [Rhodofomes roseus]KAH9830303.1 hypothetical protein C8Q71DRAFT_786748 [Rhodofomes roseus]
MRYLSDFPAARRQSRGHSCAVAVCVALPRPLPPTRLRASSSTRARPSSARARAFFPHSRAVDSSVVFACCHGPGSWSPCMSRRPRVRSVHSRSRSALALSDSPTYLPALRVSVCPPSYSIQSVHLPIFPMVPAFPPSCPWPRITCRLCLQAGH